MATVSKVERYVLSPPEYGEFRCPFHDNNECACEPDSPFQLDEDNLVVSTIDKNDLYNNVDNYARIYNTLPVGEVKNRMEILCRDEAGKHVFRKVRWRAFTEPCPPMYPVGIWEFGFSPIVLHGEQTDVALLLPSERVFIKKS